MITWHDGGTGEHIVTVMAEGVVVAVLHARAEACASV
jgi:hypothetical protein